MEMDDKLEKKKIRILIFLENSSFPLTKRADRSKTMEYQLAEGPKRHIDPVLSVQREGLDLILELVYT